MMRFFLCAAVAVVVQPMWAQQNVGCYGAVVLKAGRNGPCTALAQQIAALVEDPAVARAHWGIDVVEMDGAPIYSLNEEQFFQPASNAKLFTTAAAMALLGPETTFTTKVVGQGIFTGNAQLKGDVVLIGGGDANLSGRVLPYVSPGNQPKGSATVMEPDPMRYLEAMADQVAATGLKSVDGDVVGDDTLFPWEPYPSDWSIDDMVWGYGAPVSALTINDNQLKVTVRPGAVTGSGNASVAVDPAMPVYYKVDDSQLVTGVAEVGNNVQIERAPGSKVLRIYGGIGLRSAPIVEEVAIQDPAEFAAMALKGMLEARGIEVKGVARAQHQVQRLGMGFLKGSTELGDTVGKNFAEGRKVDCGTRTFLSQGEPGWEERVLARHDSMPLKDDLVVTNKVSQNLHAELFLHHLGGRTTCGDGSTLDGAGMIRGFLIGVVGIDKDDFVFYDGSGLSGHDLVTPRATVRLLQYAVGQAWFADWKASLPVGGVDGSLEGRFAKAPLKGKVWAKTGTLGEARALSGYVECASGRTVIFSIMVGNHAPQNNADREAMDKIVAAIAAAN
jgi:serine-type D-Ala-D-Ala carboxypeptidase/endopeptidase (penicillin-binding protein 4)